MGMVGIDPLVGTRDLVGDVHDDDGIAVLQADARRFFRVGGGKQVGRFNVQRGGDPAHLTFGGGGQADPGALAHIVCDRQQFILCTVDLHHWQCPSLYCSVYQYKPSAAKPQVKPLQVCPAGPRDSHIITKMQFVVCGFGLELLWISPDCLMIVVLRVIRIFRRFVGRGLDPAAGTFRQARLFRRIVRFTIGCRGGPAGRPGNVPAARNVAGKGKTSRRGQDPALRNEGTGMQTQSVRGKAHPRLPPKIPLLWSGGAGCTIYRVPKRAGRNLSKKSKKGVDKGEPGWYYSQAVRRGSAGRQAGKPHRYSLERVSGAKSS